MITGNAMATENDSVAETAARTVQGAWKQHVALSKLASLGEAPPSRWAEALEEAHQAIVKSSVRSEQPVLARWRKAEKLASLIGKGISHADDDAPPLTLLTEHWLEATDEKHRYGSNLAPYHAYWRSSSTTEPFFYWLDQGSGKSLSLPERPRERLEKEMVTYLASPFERLPYKVVVKDGLLVYEQSGEPVHTLGDGPLKDVLPDSDPRDSEAERLRKKAIRNKRKHIYVMDNDGNLYVARKIKGGFHHSSFLNGAAVSAAGGLVVDHGRLVKINPKSGHYQPASINFDAAIEKLRGGGIDMSAVTVSNPFTRDGTTGSVDDGSELFIALP